MSLAAVFLKFGSRFLLPDSASFHAGELIAVNPGFFQVDRPAGVWLSNFKGDAMIFTRQKSGSPAPAHRMHQFVFIESPIRIVAELALDWGNAIWWPQNVGMKYALGEDIPLQTGRKYQLRFTKPLIMNISAEVTQYDPGRSVVHHFSSVFFEVDERIILEERSNGTRVDIEVLTKSSSFVHRCIARLLFIQAHRHRIEVVLRTIKDYSEKIYKERQETV